MKHVIFERCMICDWYELDPLHAPPFHRHVVDGVCHVCLGAIASTLHTPSVDLPDPFEGTLGGVYGVEDHTLPPRMPLGATETGSTAVSLGTLVPHPQKKELDDGTAVKIPSTVS
jgi:hypothetical protein